MARKILLQRSKGSTVEILDGIITFLSKITSELSECKRYLEPKSYSRKGKNYALCEFLSANREKKIIIGVQRGEKSLVYDKIDTLLSNGHVQVATLRQLARSIKDFSDYTLILAGHLLPSHFQILLKNWKEIRIFTYKGKNYYWVKNQIKLLNYIDISKEELSLKYLAEIFQKVMGNGNYSIQRDPLFRNFLEKKKQLVKKEEPEGKQSKEVKTELEFLEEDVIITSTSITDMCRQIMKSNSKYRDLINEEKTKSIVKRYNKKAIEKYFEKIEQFECIVVLENEMSGKEITTNLEIGKKYLYFNDLHNIKIESCFPHSLKKEIYLILFGEKEKLSISDFVKGAFGLEEDIDYKLIEEWQGRLADYYLRNFNNYRQFHRKYVDSTPSIISSTQFNNWIKGKTNYTQDPMNLHYLGEVMEDEFFINNYKLIHEEGIKIQSFNQKLSKRIKKLVVKVLDGNISRADCSPDELLLLENIENCIYKIKDIKIKK